MSEEPRDFADWMFMRRAADKIGRRINGASWTGDEFDARLISRVTGPLRPNEAYARALLAEHSPDRPLPPRPERIRSLPQSLDMRLSELTPGQRREMGGVEGPALSAEGFQAADELAQRLNVRAADAIERRKGLFNRLVRDAEAGRLTVSTYDERSDPSDMPADWWRSRYAHDWLQAFQMEPRRRFERPSRSFAEFLYSGFAWLYVRRDRLAAYVASIPAAEVPRWWRGPKEPLKSWMKRSEVAAELEGRLTGLADTSQKAMFQQLASMTGECGRPAEWESIQTIWLEQRRDDAASERARQTPRN